MLLTALPTDILHDILLTVDSRKALASFILSSRCLNEVFKLHPNSTLRQVVCNEIGMDIRVLPYAWAHLRYLGNARLPVEMTPPIKNTIPGLGESLTMSVTPYTFLGLKQGHQFVSYMAQYYSIRFKESRVLRDTLTAEESRHFHIGAYLFCHYQTIWRSFQSFHYLNAQEDPEEERAQPDMQDVKTTAACHEFLVPLSTKELFWILEIRDFLLQDINYVMDLKGPPEAIARAIFDAHPQAFSHAGQRLSVDLWCHHLLSTSVAYFRQWKAVLRSEVYFPTKLEKQEVWLTDAVDRVLRERGIKGRPKDDPEMCILQSHGFLIHTCQRCGQNPQGSQRLYNKTNLKEAVFTWDHRKLPGNLASNPVEMSRIRRRIFDPLSDPTSDLTSAMSDIITHAEGHLQRGASFRRGQVNPPTHRGSGNPDHTDSATTGGLLNNYEWNPDDVLCASCFGSIFEGHYFSWWLEERKTNRMDEHAFLRDCPSGIMCTIQQDFIHSCRFNHCCPDLRIQVASP